MGRRPLVCDNIAKSRFDSITPALRLDFIRPSPYIFLHLIAVSMNLRPCVALIVLCIINSAAFGRQGSVPTLPLKRIFSRPSLPGSRPTDPKLSPDGRLLLFRWDSTARDNPRYWMQVLNKNISGLALNKFDSGLALNKF